MNTDISQILISDSELEKYGQTGSVSQKAKALLNQQKQTWDLAKKNYRNLDKVQIREFNFDNFVIKVQFNPGRIKSSAAKVDKKSISERPCFLCYPNLPDEQKGVLFKNTYLILVNPYPIFTEHFTIPQLVHSLQLVASHIPNMLDLSAAMTDSIVFYNGPKCGASAPDHFHFQAGNKTFLPIYSEYDSIVKTKGEIIHQTDKIIISSVKNYLRSFIAFESEDKDLLVEKIYVLFDKMEAVNTTHDEPMLNILSYYEDNRWRVIVFPRGKHRPRQYHAKGDENILISPASVDFGGIFITPQEKDFKKITRNDIIDIFKQVSVSDDYFDDLTSVLS